MEDRILEKREKDIVADDITDITLIQARYYWDAGYNEFDFTCKIRGEDDVLHVREQRHDEGYGIVIHSEKDDIWKRIKSSEVYKLDDKLQEVIQYGNYHKRIEKLNTLDDCKDLEFELMENDSVYLNRVIGKLWTELETKEKEIVNVEVLEAHSQIVSDFRSRTEKLFHKLDGQSADDIEKMVATYVQEKIEEENLDVEIIDVVVSGSRSHGIEKNNSDLDMVVEYKGSIREDDLFNILNEDGFEIAGIKVDINPITEGKSGTLEEYLPNVEKYLEEKKQKVSVREKLKEKKAEVCAKEENLAKGNKKKIETVK